MPRSYRFEHFQVPKRTVAPMPSEEKRELVESELPARSGELHYGRQFDQTQKLSRSKRAERTQGPKLSHAAAAEEAPPSGVPIGALPPTEELAPELLAPTVSSLAADLRESLGRLGHAYRDLRDATLGLVRLPRDAARLLRLRLQALGQG